MLGILFTGGIMGLFSYFAFLAEFYHNHHSANHYEKAITVTFVSIIFCQYANLLSRRTAGNAFGKYLFSNRNLLYAFAFSVFCIILIVYVPILNSYFHTSPLLFVDWLFPITAAIICMVIYEFRKKIILRSIVNQH